MSYFVAAGFFLLAFLVFCWVTGLALQARLGLLEGGSNVFPRLLAIPVGTGILVTLLFLLVLAGWLAPVPVVAVSMLALLLSIHGLQRNATGWWRLPLAGPVRQHPYAAGLVLLALGILFLRALAPPLEWDELAYHLPLAREFAQAGGLVVPENLRYPLNTFNLQLLWSAALLFANETAPHLVNAALAALVALGVYALGRHLSCRATGVVAALMFLYLAKGLVDTAYPDIALAAFFFFSFQALLQWRREGRGGYLLLSAFLLAMAVGTKYQGLLYLPVFALALLYLDRGLKTWLRAGVVLLLFGSGWYVRTAVISGDPVNPLGGPLFGYWAWNASDLANQYADIARYGHHLPLVLTPALLFPFLAGRKRPENVVLMIVCYGGLLLWYLTSRYDRYLVALTPFLAILSARVIVAGTARLRSRLPQRGKPSRALPLAVKFTLFFLVLAGGLAVGARQWEKACFTGACVERAYARELYSWPVMQAVPNFEALDLYQFGLTNELYLLGEDVVGDWFGPYRFEQLRAAFDNPVALKATLQELGCDSIIVNRARPWFSDFPKGEALAGEFITLYEDDRVALYAIAP